MTILEDILKREPIMKSSNRKGVLIILTFDEIKHIIENPLSNRLEIPLIQSDLDEDKVEQIYSCYLKNNSFFLSKMILTIAYLEDDTKKEFYLIDGQHRVNAIIKLVSDEKINDHVIISFQKIDSIAEVQELFCELNKDSVHNASNVEKTVTERMKIFEIKKHIKSSWAPCFSTTKSTATHFYTIDEFVSILDEIGYFDNFITNSEIDFDGFIKDLDMNQKIFFKKIKYLEDVTEDKYYKMEISMIKDNKNMMASKHNNFVSFLCYNHEPYHENRGTRIKFTKEQRKNIWKKEFKNKNYGKCPIFGCKNELRNNVPYGFHVGHIKSLKHKGINDESNLRPICASCNHDMGVSDWDEYNEKIKRLHLWERYNCENECHNDDCSKDIELHNFKYIELKNRNKITYKLICKKCFAKYEDSSRSSDSDREVKPTKKTFTK
jgi:hypothetical protein